MPLFSRKFLRQFIEKAGITDISEFSKTASKKLIAESKKFDSEKSYDIFLSHSYLDAAEIYILKTIIESFGFSIYVDWIENGVFNRNSVTKETAKLLKDRIVNCRCLFFTTSENSPKSVWMPWELGYFDGQKGKVAILPISKEFTDTEKYIGQEYLGLYPYITINQASKTGKVTLYIHENEKTYINLESWLKS